jgi:peptide/nickel transport system permease protein
MITPGNVTQPAGTLDGVRVEQASALAKTLRWSWRFTRKRPLGAVSGVTCIAILAIAVLAWTGAIVPYDPIATRGADRFLSPMSTSVDGERFYILGTDNLGRDIFSRLMKGAQLSVFFGIGVAVMSTVIGGVVGLVSAYIGGKLDLVVQRVVDAVQTIPIIVLAIALVAVVGPSLMTAFWVVALLSVPRPVRVIRGSVFSAKEEMYTEAARSLGASDYRIMFRHILPNVIAPMIVLISYVMAVAIIIEASLSFLGLGAQAPTPSWGAMLSGTGQTYFRTHPHLALMPGLAISVIVFAMNMFGDALRDELDPRLRGT